MISQMISSNSGYARMSPSVVASLVRSLVFREWGLCGSEAYPPAPSTQPPIQAPGTSTSWWRCTAVFPPEEQAACANKFHVVQWPPSRFQINQVMRQDGMQPEHFPQADDLGLINFQALLVSSYLRSIAHYCPYGCIKDLQFRGHTSYSRRVASKEGRLRLLQHHAPLQMSVPRQGSGKLHAQVNIVSDRYHALADFLNTTFLDLARLTINPHFLQ